jgi:hypothetical protein
VRLTGPLWSTLIRFAHHPRKTGLPRLRSECNAIDVSTKDRLLAPLSCRNLLTSPHRCLFALAAIRVGCINFGELRHRATRVGETDLVR